MSVLRITLAIILLSHAIPSIVSGDVNLFGRFYLDEKGFAPFGVALAWAIKLSHIIAAVCLVLNRWIVIPCLAAIAVFVAGIFMVHLQDGWFVVGNGRNGIEYNVLLVASMVSVILYDRSSRKK